MAFVARNPILRAIAIASAASNFAFAIASAVTFIFLARTLGLSPTAIGLFLAAGSIATMLAAAITPRLSRRFGSARIIWLSLAVTEPLNLISPLAQPGWSSILVVLGAAVGGAGQIVYDITNNSLRQQLCPDYLLSRLTATMRFLIMGSFPLGALLGGTLGGLIGLRGTLWVSGTLLTVAASPSTSPSATSETPPTYPPGHHQPPNQARAILPGRPSPSTTASGRPRRSVAGQGFGRTHRASI